LLINTKNIAPILYFCILKVYWPSHVYRGQGPTNDWQTKHFLSSSYCTCINIHLPFVISDGEKEDTNNNATETPKEKFRRLIKLSETRWLVVSDCVERVLQHYDTLKLHFDLAYSHERCYYAKNLSEMYKDEKNRLLLLFLHPVLKDLKRLTLLFQSNEKDSLKVFHDLKIYFLSLAARLLKNSAISHRSAEALCDVKVTDFVLLDIEDIDYGSSFLSEVEKSQISKENKSDVKLWARAFLSNLFTGLQGRLKGLFTLQSKVEHFTMTSFMKKRFQSGDFPAPFFDQSATKQAEYQESCRQIQLQAWNCEGTEPFWIAVHGWKDALGRHPYRNVSEGVLKILCLPVSNGEVERLFSQINVVKDKKRNRMKTDLLEAILHIKFGLRRLDTKCQTFNPPVELCNFNASMYAQETEDENV
jgi:hypothetical protein